MCPGAQGKSRREDALLLLLLLSAKRDDSLKLDFSPPWALPSWDSFGEPLSAHSRDEEMFVLTLDLERDAANFGCGFPDTSIALFSNLEGILPL